MVRQHNEIGKSVGTIEYCTTARQGGIGLLKTLFFPSLSKFQCNVLGRCF